MHNGFDLRGRGESIDVVFRKILSDKIGIQAIHPGIAMDDAQINPQVAHDTFGLFVECAEFFRDTQLHGLGLGFQLFNIGAQMLEFLTCVTRVSGNDRWTRNK